MNALSAPTDFAFSYADFQKQAPAAHDALIAMSKSVDASGLEKSLTELVKIRISQMNGCGFCTELHLRAARQIGVSEDKLDLLAVWRDSTEYDERERAGLFWAEHVTQSPVAPVPEAEMTAIRAVFSDDELVQLTVAIANINAWNRIAGALHFSAAKLSRV
ncbi:alkylhydroperoxidase AhpD family core domain-containing protein [Cohaesibacter marisflavi]|uniref:Alkylhydroperoxidase AhpD family core domain-containing protein n=1 Tax=Cohaesibacter marisflavi TaxID=655353 RepID=A0A1I4ZBI2_9HYPH|nr:carboxymuconolactone decarboxylase family protein [Cohaesibacter marisflavi]SFN47644.1 alkylhydroperoxidase AhpD family core domain-containing protein [Cohaesibacter marisflavi]